MLYASYCSDWILSRISPETEAAHAAAVFLPCTIFHHFPERIPLPCTQAAMVPESAAVFHKDLKNQWLTVINVLLWEGKTDR